LIVQLELTQLEVERLAQRALLELSPLMVPLNVHHVKVELTVVAWNHLHVPFVQEGLLPKSAQQLVPHAHLERLHQRDQVLVIPAQPDSIREEAHSNALLAQLGLTLALLDLRPAQPALLVLMLRWTHQYVLHAQEVLTLVDPQAPVQTVLQAPPRAPVLRRVRRAVRGSTRPPVPLLAPTAPPVATQRQAPRRARCVAPEPSPVLARRPARLVLRERILRSALRPAAPVLLAPTRAAALLCARRVPLGRSRAPRGPPLAPRARPARTRRRALRAAPVVLRATSLRRLPRCALRVR